MGIRPGDEVYFRIEGGQVILEAKSPEQWLKEFLTIVPRKHKRRLTKPLDLDRLHEEQIEERLGLGE